MSQGAAKGDTHKILGLGVCGVDLLAYLPKFPKPDDKVRTADFQVQGGGNAGNTLTGLSRLGVKTSIVTKVGPDAYGSMIKGELAAEGVDTTLVVEKAGINSPFTYVIVEAEGQTRTCIHTPSEDIVEGEIYEGLLDGVSLLHLDSRHTKAAIKLATLARERSIPLMLDAEKDRPHLRDLVPLCDYITTNAVFPMTFTGSSTLEEGMAALLTAPGAHARVITTTLGSRGCMLMQRTGDDMFVGTEEEEESDALPLQTTTEMYSDPRTKVDFRVTRCGAWPLNGDTIVDTTGAGDAFIAGLIYGVTRKHSVPRMLNLAAYVACQKLKGPGARSGLPVREKVPTELL